MGIFYMVNVMRLFDKNLNRVSLRFFTPVLQILPSWITPNFITIFGGIFSTLIVLIATFKNDLNFVIWGSLLCLIFDILDGSLARFRKINSGMGEKLDLLTDIFITIILISSFSFKFNIFEIAPALFLIFLYVIRIIFVFKNLDSGIGGFRSPLLICMLLFYLSELKDGGWLIYILIIWNILSLLISVRKIKACQNNFLNIL